MCVLCALCGFKKGNLTTEETEFAQEDRRGSGTVYTFPEYVIPANAGIQGDTSYWMPAFAGMTIKLYHYHRGELVTFLSKMVFHSLTLFL